MLSAALRKGLGIRARATTRLRCDRALRLIQRGPRPALTGPPTFSPCTFDTGARLDREECVPSSGVGSAVVAAASHKSTHATVAAATLSGGGSIIAAASFPDGDLGKGAWTATWANYRKWRERYGLRWNLGVSLRGRAGRRPTAIRTYRRRR